MPAERVAVVCIDPWTAHGSDYRPFNYSARKVLAAVMAAPELKGVKTQLIETGDPNAAELARRIEAFAPDVLGFSAYVWSFATMLEIAAQVRRSLPETLIVFGGPSARPEMFALPPYRPFVPVVDALVPGEGEVTFPRLCALSDRSEVAKVPGLAVPMGTGFRSTGEPELPDLSKLASPYALGLVEPGSTAHLESFRGCPLSCSFCQWGDERDSSRVFPEEVLRAELEQFERLKMSGVYLVDAALNLSARAFKGLHAALKDSALWGRARLRTEIYPSNLTEMHLEVLAGAKAEAVGIGLQSFDEDVLDGVERPFDAKRFERVVADVAAIVPETTVEIILGLPGDTPENFKRTVQRAKSLPTELRVFRCLVLPGALMSRAAPDAALEYDPVTLEMQSCKGWSREALAEAVEWVDREAHAAGGERNGRAIWRFPRPGAGPVGGRSVVSEAKAAGVPSVAPRLLELIGGAVQRGSSAAWRVQDVERRGETVSVVIEAGEAPLRVTIERAKAGRASFRVVGELAFSYGVVPAAPTAGQLVVLDQVIQSLGAALAAEPLQ